MDMDSGIRRNDDGRSVVRQNEASAYSPGTWFAGMTTVSCSLGALFAEVSCLLEALFAETRRSLSLPLARSRLPSPRRRPGSSLRMDMDSGIRRNDDGRSVVRQNEASAYSPGTWFAGMTIEEGLVHETQRSLPLPSPLLHCSSPRRRPGSSLRMDMDSGIRRNDDSEIFSTRRRCRYPSRRSGRGFCGITTRRK